MRLLKKVNADDNTFQVCVPLPKLIAKTYNISKGDKVWWKVTTDLLLVLVRTINPYRDIKYYSVHTQGIHNRLYITLPRPLFQAMMYHFEDDFQWINKANFLCLKKGIERTTKWKKVSGDSSQA
jgi:hypothetical protein